MATKKTIQAEEDKIMPEDPLTATFSMQADSSVMVDDVLSLEAELETKKKAAIAALLERQRIIAAQLERLGYSTSTSDTPAAPKKAAKKKSGQRAPADRECPICSKKHGVLIKGHDSRSHRHHPKAYTLDEIQAMND